MRPARALMNLISALVVAAALGGCYEHVVRAEGLGSDRHDIHEPNLKEEPRPTGPPVKMVPSKTVPTKPAEP